MGFEVQKVGDGARINPARAVNFFISPIHYILNSGPQGKTLEVKK